MNKLIQSNLNIYLREYIDELEADNLNDLRFDSRLIWN